ncbi:8609_t:CDS:2 [Paraglomus brasilianum]|uniref:8609_t:CDS:1 n=1 Tax=Paraglomus brasilianum TaxID=144538 RepID=A0A9N9CV13_9GLOM|nr:8609_t:CDS:2 [Paraglomus brasilianum]
MSAQDRNSPMDLANNLPTAPMLSYKSSASLTAHHNNGSKSDTQQQTVEWTDEERLLWLFYKLNVVYLNLNQLPLIFKSVYHYDIPWLDNDKKLLYSKFPHKLRKLLQCRSFPHYTDLYDRSYPSDCWRASPSFVKPLDIHSHVLTSKVFGRDVTSPTIKVMETRLRTLLPDRSRISIELLRELYESLYPPLTPDIISSYLVCPLAETLNDITPAYRTLLQHIKSSGLEMGTYYLTIKSKEDCKHSEHVDYVRVVRRHMGELNPEHVRSDEKIGWRVNKDKLIDMRRAPTEQLEQNEKTGWRTGRDISIGRERSSIERSEHDGSNSEEGCLAKFKEEILTLFQNTFYYRPSTLEEAYVATYDRQPPIRSKSKTVSVADLLSTEYPSEFAIVYLKSNLSFICRRSRQPFKGSEFRFKITSDRTAASERKYSESRTNRKPEYVYPLEVAFARVYCVAAPSTELTTDDLEELYYHLYQRSVGWHKFKYTSFGEFLADSNGFDVRGRLINVKQCRLSELLKHKPSPFHLRTDRRYDTRNENQVRPEGRGTSKFGHEGTVRNEIRDHQMLEGRTMHKNDGRTRARLTHPRFDARFQLRTYTKHSTRPESQIDMRHSMHGDARYHAKHDPNHNKGSRYGYKRGRSPEEGNIVSERYIRRRRSTSPVKHAITSSSPSKEDRELEHNYTSLTNELLHSPPMGVTTGMSHNNTFRSSPQWAGRTLPVRTSKFNGKRRMINSKRSGEIHGDAQRNAKGHLRGLRHRNKRTDCIQDVQHDMSHIDTSLSPDQLSHLSRSALWTMETSDPALGQKSPSYSSIQRDLQDTDSHMSTRGGFIKPPIMSNRKCKGMRRMENGNERRDRERGSRNRSRRRGDADVYERRCPPFSPEARSDDGDHVYHSGNSSSSRDSGLGIRIASSPLPEASKEMDTAGRYHGVLSSPAYSPDFREKPTSEPVVNVLTSPTYSPQPQEKSYMEFGLRVPTSPEYSSEPQGAVISGLPIISGLMVGAYSSTYSSVHQEGACNTSISQEKLHENSDMSLTRSLKSEEKSYMNLSSCHPPSSLEEKLDRESLFRNQSSPLHSHDYEGKSHNDLEHYDTSSTSCAPMLENASSDIMAKGKQPEISGSLSPSTITSTVTPSTPEGYEELNDESREPNERESNEELSEKKVNKEVSGKVFGEAKEELNTGLSGEVFGEAKEELNTGLSGEVFREAKEELNAGLSSEVFGEAMEELNTGLSGEVFGEATEELNTGLSGEPTVESIEERKGECQSNKALDNRHILLKETDSDSLNPSYGFAIMPVMRTSEVFNELSPLQAAMIEAIFIMNKEMLDNES